MVDCKDVAKRAKKASEALRSVSTDSKNRALFGMRDLLLERMDDVVRANDEDMAAAKEKGLAANLMRRLLFDSDKVRSRAASLEKIAGLPDPAGQMEDMTRRPNGLMVGRMRVPLGVILMIYEARPHVTVNAGAFALKSGNAIILKGGREATRCNTLLGELWAEALEGAGLPGDAVQSVSAGHDEVAEMLRMTGEIDLVIPRGGKGLIENVARTSLVPVIKHFEGICHVYVDGSADPGKAERITLNSKLLMPEVCNAAETLLISEELGGEGIRRLTGALRDNGVEVRGCEKVVEYDPEAKPATRDDWATEYLDRIMSVRVVNGLDAAMEHIGEYGSGHTDTIVTENYTRAMRFVEEVDSGVVLVNASTMFDDGEELGLGAEIGISTDKLHARGPMGLRELTTYKFVVLGEDHIKQ